MFYAQSTTAVTSGRSGGAERGVWGGGHEGAGGEQARRRTMRRRRKIEREVGWEEAYWRLSNI